MSDPNVQPKSMGYTPIFFISSSTSSGSEPTRENKFKVRKCPLCRRCWEWEENPNRRNKKVYWEKEPLYHGTNFPPLSCEDEVCPECDEIENQWWERFL